MSTDFFLVQFSVSTQSLDLFWSKSTPLCLRLRTGIVKDCVATHHFHQLRPMKQ